MEIKLSNFGNGHFPYNNKNWIKNKLCINKETLFQVKTIAEKKKFGIFCRIQKILKLLLK